jgi:hypothetical protein
VLELKVRRLDKFPTVADWDALPWLKLVSANPGRNPQVEAGEFKMLALGDNLCLLAKFTEPLIKQSKTKAGRSAEDWDNLWLDNEVELFFYSDVAANPVQVIINDAGFYAVNQVGIDNSMSTKDQFKVVTAKSDNAWTLEAVFPAKLTGIQPNRAGDCRFNITRGRNVLGAPQEYSTWSPQAVLGKWTDISKWGRIKFIDARKELPVYTGQAQAPAGKITPEMMLDFTTPPTNWNTWVNNGGKSKLSHDKTVGHQSPGCLLIDMSSDSASCDPGAAWVFKLKMDSGSRLRISAWGRLESNDPESCLFLKAGWMNTNSGWIKDTELFGRATVSAIIGQWTLLALDITVPVNENVQFLAIVLGSEKAFPGKVWFDDVNIEVIK